MPVAYAVGLVSDLATISRFKAFYKQYAVECRDMRAAPLSPEVLLALLETVLERECHTSVNPVSTNGRVQQLRCALSAEA